MSSDGLGCSVGRKLTIFFCGADWSWAELVKRGFRRRYACILRELVKHPEVERVFVFTNVMRPTYFEMMRRPHNEREFENGKVVDVYVSPLLPERPWLPGFAAINCRFMQRQVEAQTGNLFELQPLVWCYWPAGFRLACRLNLPGRWVFDADHDLLHDENESTGKPAEVERVLNAVIHKVDVVMASTCSALNWFADNGARHVLRLRNGVTTALVREAAVPPRNPDKPRIGYIGVLSKWVDYDLLEKIVAARPGWQFVIGGPIYRAQLPASLKEMPHVEWLGVVEPARLPDVLATFDVALGLYRGGPWQDMDSMKLFDYLAAGLPTVCSNFHPHLREDFGGLLELANGPDEFVAGIERVLNHDAATRAEWDSRRQRFIAAHTWEREVGAALKTVRVSTEKSVA